jgi:hypothetical protein
VASTGIVGDIHLRDTELATTLAGPLADCERIIASGDFLDRGPADPAELLHTLLDSGVELLVGNHELAYLGGPRFSGMMEDRCVPVAKDLRGLVLDGKLKAAAVCGDVLVVHAGISHGFWKRNLQQSCADDPVKIALHLNKVLLRAVARGDFADPIFGALRDDERGPFWADLESDLTKLPPFRQAVGHTVVSTPGWRGSGAATVFPLEWAEGARGNMLGHLVVTE